jgi:osmotically-inducible protein OsmY
MRDQGRFIGGLLVGAAIMYLLDPDRGGRRRALVRDQAARARNKLGDGLDATARDLGNRARGTAAELRSRFRREVVDDTILHERVRSEIGHAVSHPGAIEVSVSDGRVTLQGSVLEQELDKLLSTAGQVRGVSEVINELTVHREPGGIPSLQGGASRGTTG